MFISFEGIEGVGKSTQIKLLQDYLIQNDCDVVTSFEPGATPVGAAIRKVILDPETTLHNPITETLLFTADRLEHLAQVVEPALAQGKWVLSDRYVDSTVAYQIGGRQIESSLVQAILGTTTRLPDLTILLDAEPAEGLKRAKARADLDRFEQEAMAFHHRVRDQFLASAKENPDRFRVIQVGGLDIDAVFHHIKSVVDPYIGKETL